MNDSEALQSPRKRRIFQNLAIWLLLACAFAAFTSAVTMPTDLALLHRGVQVPARRLKTLNGLFGYEFKVGGKTYRDAATAARQETLQPGEKLTIVYVRNNPNISTELGAGDKLKGDLAFVVGCTLVFPIHVMLLFQRFLLPTWKRRWQNAGPGNLT